MIRESPDGERRGACARDLLVALAEPDEAMRLAAHERIAHLGRLRRQQADGPPASQPPCLRAALRSLRTALREARLGAHELVLVLDLALDVAEEHGWRLGDGEDVHGTQLRLAGRLAVCEEALDLYVV